MVSVREVWTEHPKKKKGAKEKVCGGGRACVFLWADRGRGVALFLVMLVFLLFRKACIPLPFLFFWPWLASPVFIRLQPAPVNRERFISKLFVRGDSVIMVLKNPKQ